MWKIYNTVLKNGDAMDWDPVKEYLSANLMAALSFFLARLNNEVTNSETKLNILSSLADLCR